MIDLIIPYYNNPEGLKRTLASIDQNIFYVTIIDDNSDQTLWHPNASQVFRYNKNRGPGYARQLGIEKTFNPYIMFLDTGDIFISKEVQQTIANEVYSSNQDLISFQYYHYDKIAEEKDNRMHGRIYKRSFLNKYNITFPLASSYYDEDIGFNRACNIIIEQENLLSKRINIPIIKQIREKNSLTQRNNQETLYRDQTRALSLITIHTIEICRKNNINYETELNQISMALYYWFLNTIINRPIFAREAWSGVKIFYDYFNDEIKPHKLLIGNAYIKKCLEFRNKLKFPINILRFVDEVQNNEIIPDKYLTLS